MLMTIKTTTTTTTMIAPGKVVINSVALTDHECHKSKTKHSKYIYSGGNHNKQHSEPTKTRRFKVSSTRKKVPFGFEFASDWLTNGNMFSF